MRRYLVILFFFMSVFISNAQSDWASFGRYQSENSSITVPPVAVLIGDSITDVWASYDPAFFKENNFIGRGISGQTSSHILVRFRADALALKPKVVLILAGTNDVALNGGCIPPEHVFDNIVNMVQLATANGVVPIVCSITPSDRFRWRPEVKPVSTINEINARLKKYTSENGILYLDYYSALATETGAFNPSFTNDGTHPTLDGYKVMESLMMPMVEKALKMYPKCNRKAIFR